ncbi:MAG: DUF2059 domain-containing protein [Betaproteobacteria bacterium]|nr:MAG: DUF2059 domain-containing protein [Betaproteobacteria bacterium]
MTKQIISILCLVLSSSAAAQVPSAASVEALLVANRTESALAATVAQMEQMIRQNLAQATAGRTLTDQQKSSIETAPQRLLATVKDDLSWDALKPVYVAAYQQTLTQTEVDLLIQLYKSPAGAVLLDRVPVALQKSGAVVQARMPAVIEKIRAMILREIAAAKSSTK